ncbi:MAG: hypothetical protein A4E42_00462 [Methanoregulaceae archaeon PtaU1.Bin222]|nr:MAG: hypothetical protein A4E42_00462 [Methanoregulaceae archaeon PtaU1.Bin222]
MDIPGEVMIGEMRGELKEILLLADLVRLFLVGCLGIFLQVSIVLRLEPAPHVNEMGIEDRSPYPCADIPVLDQSPLHEGYVYDLPDERPAQGTEFHGLDPLLHESGNLLGSLFSCTLVSIERGDQFGLFHDLAYNSLPVPLQDMSIRGPDGRH